MQCGSREDNVRLVLDTNIVISGLIWGGVPRQLLDLAGEGQVDLYTSGVLLDELSDVLSRSKFVALLASQAVLPTALMQHYGMLTRLVMPQAIERTVRDADDDAVIATALAAQADVIVTGDSDLLAMCSYQNIQILHAAEALRRVIPVR